MNKALMLMKQFWILQMEPWHSLKLVIFEHFSRFGCQNEIPRGQILLYDKPALLVRYLLAYQ